MGQPERSASARPRRELLISCTALVVAVLAARMFATVGAYVTSAPLRLALDFLVTWLPMLAAVGAACGVSWTRVVRHLGVRFHPLDLCWGVAAGFFARAIDGLVRLQLYGTTGLGRTVSIDVGATDAFWLTAVGTVAVVVLAPIIEELFFRGLMQRSITDVLRGVPQNIGRGVAIIVVSAIFALVHVLVTGDSDLTMLGELVGTFVFGFLAGIVTAATGRLGAAVIAHIVFNGIVVLLATVG